MIEEKDFDVTIVLRLSMPVSFAPIERDRPIESIDAIENAIGSFDWSLLENVGFSIAYPIEGEATPYDP